MGKKHTGNPAHNFLSLQRIGMSQLEDTRGWVEGTSPYTDASVGLAASPIPKKDPGTVSCDKNCQSLEIFNEALTQEETCRTVLWLSPGLPSPAPK
jgi:hypothetical protein